MILILFKEDCAKFKMNDKNLFERTFPEDENPVCLYPESDGNFRYQLCSKVVSKNVENKGMLFRINCSFVKTWRNESVFLLQIFQYCINDWKYSVTKLKIFSFDTHQSIRTSSDGRNKTV